MCPLRVIELIYIFSPVFDTYVRYILEYYLNIVLVLSRVFQQKEIRLCELNGIIGQSSLTPFNRFTL